MISEAHDLSGLLPREPDKDEGDRKADEVGDEMEGITDNRDGAGDVATHKLAGDKDKRNDNDGDQFFEVGVIVLFGRRLVDFSVFVFAQ